MKTSKRVSNQKKWANRAASCNSEIVYSTADPKPVYTPDKDVSRLFREETEGRRWKDTNRTSGH